MKVRLKSSKKRIKKRTWLLLDVSYLAYRSYFALGQLSSKGVRTEVTFGLLRDLPGFMDAHNTSRIVFCFDGGNENRSEIYPNYKANHNRYLTETEIEGRNALRKQLKKLRTEYLYDLGFQNICWQKGYEADDVIASICKNLEKGDQAVIIGADKDLYQLLSRRVFMWNPRTREPTTVESFEKQYGIEPKQWPLVLAIAGGHDNIGGVPGVGEMTALRYIRRELPTHSKAWMLIQQHREMIKRNLKLVKLPFPGTEEFELVDDRIQRMSWDALIDRFEMTSLQGKSRG